MENKYKDWLKLGFIGYLLSLPILLWRSSRVGKAISLFLLLLVLMKFLNFTADWGLKFYTRFVVLGKIKPILQETEELEKAFAKTKLDLDLVDQNIKESIKNRIDAFESQKSSLLESQNEKIKQIEDSLNILKDQERQAVKDRIIEIKEQIKVYKKSIDSKEIRKELELIASNISLLSQQEKERFLKDLEDIGFQIEVSKQKVAEIVTYVGGERIYGVSSGVVVEAGGWYRFNR